MRKPILFSAVATSAAVLVALAVALLIQNDAKQAPTQLDVRAAREDVVSPDVHSSTAPVETSEAMHVPAVTPSVQRDWLRDFNESVDDFALAQDLVAAATAGDARAQHVLGRVLLECEALKRGLAQYPSGTLAQRVEAHLSALPHDLERSRRAFRQRASRCERLFAEDPFSGLDLPDEANGYRYWATRALESGDPLAVMERAVRSIAGRGATSEAAVEPAFRANLLSDVRHVAFAGDAVALFSVGGVLSHPSVVADPTDGYAWQVAACEMGYDCSKANPALGFGCTEDGTCDAGETFLDVMQRDLGAVEFAEIYASAQDIQYRIRTNDWDGLQKYVRIKE